jgi:hypothetical protein
MDMDEEMAHMAHMGHMARTSQTPSSSRSVSPASSGYPDSERFLSASTPDPALVQAYTDLMASLLPSAMTLAPACTPVGFGVLDMDQTAPIPRSHGDGVDHDHHDDHDDHDDHGSGLAESGRALTKAEKQNAKKKRRKERERAARLEEETSLAKERAHELARSTREEERKRMVTSGSGRFVSSAQR